MLNILIIDDEADIPFLFRHKFKKEIRDGELSLHFCSGGQEAINYLKLPSNPRIDLILTDINMPGMSGLELIKQIKSIYPEIIIYIITAYAESLNLEIGRAYGADEFLTKPLEFSIIKEKMANLFIKTMN